MVQIFSSNNTDKVGGATGLQIFTICARNYAAHAAVLAESIARWHPDAEFTVWMLDATPKPEVLAGGRVRDLRELFSENQFRDLRVRYAPLEFLTAVKPWACAQLLAEGADFAIYLDPDIYVFQPLTAALDRMRAGAAGILVPHSLTPLPRDGCHPDDYDLLKSGSYNLGFLALRNCEPAFNFLLWWQTWLFEHASCDHRTGLFTDQKWLNFAPAYWPDFEVLRDIGFDVAYWNLHERPITQRGRSTWYAASSPLVFFHFSGFDPRKPNRISHHQTRFEARPGSYLRQLLEFYAERLCAFDFEMWRDEKIEPVRFDDGAAYDVISSRLRTELIRAEGRATDAQVRKYIAEKPPGRAFPRYVEYALDLRPDVREMYRGRGLAEVAAWIMEHGVIELGLDATIAESMAPPSHCLASVAKRARRHAAEIVRHPARLIGDARFVHATPSGRKA